MKKSEITEKLMFIIQTMESGLVEANTQSKAYSTELRSQLAYELGYLSGVIKQSVAELRELK